MNIADAIDEKIIRVNLDVSDKNDALNKMTHILKENNYIVDEEEFLKDIYFRESEGVTGIGGGIAIPHGQSESVTKIGIAIAKLTHPIEWETLDDNPVDFIFLFCVSADIAFARNHMILLSKIAAKLADDDLLKKIKSADNPCKIKEYLVNG